MRRTWIGAAAAASLTTIAATAVAQDQPRQDQSPGQQKMERPQTHRVEPAQPGAIERGQSAQTQPSSEERQRNERSGQEKAGQERAGQERIGGQPRDAAGDEGKSAQGAERPAGERANPASSQTEKMNSDKRADEQSRPGAQGAKTEPQSRPESGSAGSQGEAKRTGAADKNKAERTDQATGNERSTDEKASTAAERQPVANGPGHDQTGSTPMQNNRQGETQNARRETHVDPQNVHVEGNAHLTNDRAARIADALMPARNLNVDVHIGAALPADVELLPLPPTIVDMVPEYRDYDYVVDNDQIVIVQPSTRDVVEVINTGGAQALGAQALSESGAQASAGTRLNPCGTP